MCPTEPRGRVPRCTQPAPFPGATLTIGTRMYRRSISLHLIIPFFFLTAQEHMQEAGDTVAEMCESGQRAIRELDQAQRWLDDAASSSASELDGVQSSLSQSAPPMVRPPEEPPARAATFVAGSTGGGGGGFLPKAENRHAPRKSPSSGVKAIAQQVGDAFGERLGSRGVGSRGAGAATADGMSADASAVQAQLRGMLRDNQFRVIDLFRQVHAASSTCSE